MTGEDKKVAAYLTTVDKLEPDIHPVDQDGALTSIAISMKRIADALEKIQKDVDFVARQL